jgi:hypothetical protein
LNQLLNLLDDLYHMETFGPTELAAFKEVYSELPRADSIWRACLNRNFPFPRPPIRPFERMLHDEDGDEEERYTGRN